jgi:hypothetical protein
MGKEWKQADIQRYIDDCVEESLILDYKAAGALTKKPEKKREIAKDVSAMANSAGGIVIYGVREDQEEDKKHLPEKLDPVDRTLFSKEWLEQVMNNIRPRMAGCVIHPADVDTAPNHVIYVVDIPKSTTAHQATDHRYYIRYNFQSVPMEDHEIRDVMNRATVPDAHVQFGFRYIEGDREAHRYELTARVSNEGNKVINHFKLAITFPDLDVLLADRGATILASTASRAWPGHRLVDVKPRDSRIVLPTTQPNGIGAICRSINVLFPKDEVDLGLAVNLRYWINSQVYLRIKDLPPLSWTLYADDMPSKQGSVPISELCNY